jgi:glycosyltransferase involved in cell wall biosynthesis
MTGGGWSPARGSPRPLLVVTTSYPRWAGDGAGSFVQHRVQRLVSAGTPVHLLAAGEPAGIDQAMSAPGLSVERVGYAVGQGGLRDASLFYGDGAPERLEQSPRAWLQGVRLWGGLMAALSARRGKVSGVESHWLIPSALAAAAADLGVPHRALAHSGDVALLERLPGGAGLARWLLGQLTALAFASADLRARFARLVGGAQAARVAAAEIAPAESAVVVSPHRLDPVARRRLRQRRGLDRQVVLAVGRLVPIKGHDLLIRAVSRLPPAARPTVVILGEGSQREALERLAATRRVRLLLPGQLSPAQVAQWLALADLFVHPSRRMPSGRTEGSPVALREAVTAGIPIVATITGGIPEAVAAHARSVSLIPAGDLDALTVAIARHVSETSMLRVADS